MQDRFKFRIWNKLANMMTYNFMLGNYIQISKVDYMKKDWVGVNYEPEYICFENEAIKNIEIMQCTGLKDRKGKLIYEGDIIKDLIVPEHPYIVVWFKGGFSLESTISRSFLKFDTTQQEIIGNIYEDSELLKDCKNEKYN